ncbi:f-box domain-containing protein [Ditylenchus destructor]|uniref:F-box domain-containing protein n=1 Tax=Ditylenchus destructor TaxID=166010 RepID=A0AAD4NFB1_9BILA|nr:f-box domain-containing protein [Ditylenchus destructor]
MYKLLKEKGCVIYKKVQSLFCYKNKSCEELADRRSINISSPANDSLSNLPSELLECIFCYLTPADTSRISRACSRFYFICQTRRQYLPRPCLSDLTVTYGKWRDVLKYRGKAYHDMNTVEYKVTSASTSKKKRHRKMEKRALNEIVESCFFQRVVVNVEMLNADVWTALNLKALSAENVVLNLSHPSLPNQTVHLGLE